MTVNAFAFFAVAALLVLAAAGTVGLPTLRLAGYSALACVALLALLLAVTGAYALAAILLVIPAATAWAAVTVLRGETYRGIPAASPATSARWWIAAAVATAIGLLLIVTFSLGGSQWFVGSGGAWLISVLHLRAPYALVIAVLLAAVSTGAALMVGRRSGDEHALDRHLESRRQREERTRRRREDRLQARRRNPGVPGESEA